MDIDLVDREWTDYDEKVLSVLFDICICVTLTFD